LKLGGGSSYGISLPREEVEEFGWKAKQKLVVEKYGNGLIIRDWKEGKDER
jgi:hypothetical protein